jgi:hypothetical protein
LVLGLLAEVAVLRERVDEHERLLCWASREMTMLASVGVRMSRVAKSPAVGRA